MSATDRDLTEKIATGPFTWTRSVEAGRRLERWFHTVPTPVARRWWNAQSARAQVAVIAAAVLTLVTILNVAAGLGEMTSTQTGPATSAVGNGAAALTQESAPPDAGNAWKIKGLWQGSGNRDTEEFVVGDHWRVDWIFSPAQTGGAFQIFVYRADGRLLMNVAANSKGGTDTSFWAGPGKYFLRINSSGGDWKLDVQDLR
jgi:hypothetical protein